MKLRNEILIRKTEDGCVELYDPLMQQSLLLSHEDSASFEKDSAHWKQELIQKLEDAFMLEGFATEVIRKNVWEHRTMFRLRPTIEHIPEIEWEMAQDLPSFIQKEWKRGEKWRRMFERACAGEEIFMLHDLLEPEILSSYFDSLDNFQLFPTNVVSAHRQILKEGLMVELMQDEIFRSLCQSLLRVPLQASTLIQAWKLKAGEAFDVHADGCHYVGTLTVGCSVDWKAINGGVLSFGKGRTNHWRATHNWLPQLGDALLFRPQADLMHGVSQVEQCIRKSITGWWLKEKVHVHYHD